MKPLILILVLIANAAQSETIFAARTIPAQSIIGADDLLLRGGDTLGGVSDPLMLIGMEARVALYAGRPIREADVGFPATVQRNQLISLIYNQSGLMIVTEGRALGRGAPGEVIRVMNMASRNTVSARVGDDGAAYVGGPRS